LAGVPRLAGCTAFSRVSYLDQQDAAESFWVPQNGRAGGGRHAGQATGTASR